MKPHATPLSYSLQLARLRAASGQRETEWCRYGSERCPAAFRLARRWGAALMSEPLDWRELSAIREEVRCRGRLWSWGFREFAQQIERDFLALRHAELVDRPQEP